LVGVKHLAEGSDHKVTIETYGRLTNLCVAVAILSALLFDRVAALRIPAATLGTAAALVAAAAYFIQRRKVPSSTQDSADAAPGVRHIDATTQGVHQELGIAPQHVADHWLVDKDQGIDHASAAIVYATGYSPGGVLAEKVHSFYTYTHDLLHSPHEHGTRMPLYFTMGLVMALTDKYAGSREQDYQVVVSGNCLYGLRPVSSHKRRHAFHEIDDADAESMFEKVFSRGRVKTPA